MGSSFSKQKNSNFTFTTALNKAYNDGDSRTYREIEQSIAREKQSQTRGGGRSTSHSHDSHSPSLPTPTSHTYQPMNSNMPNRHSYQPLNASHGYNGAYGMNGQRPQPVPPQGTHSLSSICLMRNVVMLKCYPGPSFRHSPFYSVLERLGPIHICEGIAPVHLQLCSLASDERK